MMVNKWTKGLAALGLVSLPAMAEEAKLFPINSTIQSTTLSGYVSSSASLVLGKGGDAVFGRSFDGPTKQNGFNLDVVSVVLEKPLEDGQWSAGYRVQSWLGPDAGSLSSVSTASIVNGGKTSDFALKNAYVALRAPVGNGLDFKLGTWDTVVGYEVADSPNNPNYSRSWGFYLEPIIHTGALATYQVSKVLSLSGGVATRGDVNNINARSGTRGIWSYVGSIALTAPESAGFLKGATLYGGVVDAGIGTTTHAGNPVPSITPDNRNPLNLYVGGSIPTPLTGVSVGAAYDYRASYLFDGSYENALGGYLTWAATEKLKLNGRVEYASGSGTVPGSTSGAFGVPTTDLSGNTSDNVKLLGVTGTLDYSLWANAITRLEIRWDETLNGQRIMNDGYARSVISVGLNVIYKF